MAEKTSLEKSHSKSSNAKLTLICLFASLSVSALWVGLVFVVLNWIVGGIILGVSALTTFISLILISKFTR